MSDLRIVDGEKWFLLPLHGMWQYKRMFVKRGNWSAAWRKA